MPINEKTPMPQEVSCRNWLLLFDYLENTPGFQSGLSGRAAVDRALEGLVDNPGYLIQDPNDPSRCYPINESHLRDPKYWHSNEFSVKFLGNVAKAIGGHRPLFLAGIICGYRTIAASTSIYFQFLRLLPFNTLVRISNRINRLFNRTKILTITRFDKNNVHIQVKYLANHGKEITSHICDWNAGLYTGFGKYNGKQDIRVTESACCTRGDDRCLFKLNFSQSSIWSRIIVFLHSLLDPDYIRSRDLDNLLLHDSKIRQNEIIKERTTDLLNAQAQLIEQERLLTESHIAGGMAHEIRNALGAAKLQLGEIYDGQLFEKTYSNLHDIFNGLCSEYGLPEKPKQSSLKAFRAAFDNQRMIEEVLDATRTSINRGLQITKRVMTYSKLHEIDNVGNVDLNEITESLYATYSSSLLNQQIDLSISFENQIVIAGDTYAVHSVFQNLLLNARDAILEKEYTGGAINISGFVVNEQIVIEVTDNGVGIPQENLDKIFLPFFSTKPSLGMGLGLNECRKIISKMGGHFEVESVLGKGTVIRINFKSEKFDM